MEVLNEAIVIAVLLTIAGASYIWGDSLERKSRRKHASAVIARTSELTADEGITQVEEHSDDVQSKKYMDYATYLYIVTGMFLAAAVYQIYIFWRY